MPACEASEDLDAAMQQLAVGGVGHRLGLDGGVDGDALEVLRLGGTGALRGGEGFGEEQFEPLGADALAPAGQRGAIQRQGVLEVGLAAEQLDVGRQAGPADAVAVERAEGDSEALPVDQAGQTDQGMAAIDEVQQGRAEQFGLLERW